MKKKADRQQEIVTFKVDKALLDALKGIPNRSRFIREAIAAALNQACPICNGSGRLTAEQRALLEEFKGRPVLKRCETCQAIRLLSVGSAEEAKG